jgi:hypothetical protein
MFAKSQQTAFCTFKNCLVHSRLLFAQGIHKKEMIMLITKILSEKVQNKLNLNGRKDLSILDSR